MRQFVHNWTKRTALFLMVLFFLVTPQFVGAAERVTNYDVDISINNDASFLVTETITYDFGVAQKHGVYRNILHRHPQDATAWYKKRSIAVEVLSVTRNGAEEQFVVSKESDQTIVKIGAAGTTITGQHVYEIRYLVAGGLSYLNDGAVELYWNATGNDWQVPIAQAHVFIGPHDFLHDESACYRGTVYSLASCNTDMLDDGVYFTAEDLGPHEGLTVASKIDGEKVPVVINEHVQLRYMIVPLLMVLLGWFVNFVYRFKTFYRPRSKTIIAQYEPYQDMLPMLSGVLIDRRLDGRDVTAGLLYLARSGFIKIKKTERKLFRFITLDEYKVTLQKEVDFTNDTRLPSEFHRTILGLLFTTVTKGTTIQLGDIKKDTSRQKKNYAALTRLRAAVIDDLVTRGFYERKYGMMRKTKKGYEAIWHLKGFKQFLSVTDKERFKFHNAPHKSPEQFLEFLPYAVAFGVEEEWAEVFKDLEIKAPEWYEGAPKSFSAAAIGSELSSFATAANAASGSGYRSSSSASGGGGFSGGGGGGGGGGSW